MKAHLVFGNKLIGIPTVKDDRVKIYEEYWTPTRLLEELRKVQACIFLTRGEGFQIPLYEATAAGLPVIACNHTAPQDFCNLGNK